MFRPPVGLTGTIDSVTIERVGGGWFRISQTPTAVSGTTYGCAIRLMDEATTNGLQYTGDGTSGIYIYGAQLEAGSTPSSYISTAGTTVTRAAEILDVAAADMPWPTPNVIGEELVTNGTFDSDVSGWAYTGTLGPDQDNYAESQSGELRLVGSATRTSRIQQSIATEIGKIYQFSFDLTSNLANQVVLEGISGTNVYNTVGSYQEVFIASATSITLVIRSSNITDVTLDNISVREIDPPLRVYPDGWDCHWQHLHPNTLVSGRQQRHPARHWINGLHIHARGRWALWIRLRVVASPVG